MLLFGAASVINAVFVRLALKMIFLACKAYQEKFKCAIIPVAFESHSLATLQWGYPGRRMCVLEVKSSGVPQNPVLVPLFICPDLRRIGLGNESNETPSADTTLFGYTSA